MITRPIPPTYTKLLSYLALSRQDLERQLADVAQMRQQVLADASGAMGIPDGVPVRYDAENQTLSYAEPQDAQASDQAP